MSDALELMHEIPVQIILKVCWISQLRCKFYISEDKTLSAASFRTCFDCDPHVSTRIFPRCFLAFNHAVFCLCCALISWHWPVCSVQRIAIGVGGLASILRPVKSDTVSSTAHNRCDISLELCCPGAQPRRWVPPA